MSTPVSLPLNVYFTRDPALVAQEKYSNATWNNAYGYITLVACAALALVANVFLFPIVHPMTLFVIDEAIAAFGYTQVWPKVEEWFAKAEKFKAQGDKEIQIQAMTPEILNGKFEELGISLPLENSTSPSQHLSFRLLARAIWHHERAVHLSKTGERLFNEKNLKEALTFAYSGAQEHLKSHFFAHIIENPHHSGKFKDALAWVEIPIEERVWGAMDPNHPGNRLVQTKEPNPRFLSMDDIKDSSSIRNTFKALLTPQTVSGP